MANQIWPLGREQLLTYLVYGSRVANAPNELLRFGCVGNVESNDEAIASGEGRLGCGGCRHFLETQPPASLTALLATRQVLRHLHLFRLHDVEAHLEEFAIFGVEQHLGRSVGEVDDARFRHRTAVVHTHYDPSAVMHVSDL